MLSRASPTLRAQGRGFEPRSGHLAFVSATSVKAIIDGCLRLSPEEENTTIEFESVYARLLAQIVQLYVFVDCTSFTSEI